MDVIRLGTWMLCSHNAVDHGRHQVVGRACSENIANTEGFGTASKGNTVNSEGFGTCRKREFGDAGNDDGTDIFGT